MARIVILLLVILFAPLAAAAQSAGKVYRIGYLTPFNLPNRGEKAFRQGLRDLGYVEGRDIVIEMRTAKQQYGELERLAAELLALKVDVIVAATGTTALALKRITSSVPIVIASSSDAVTMGIVESLRRPGGNVTGVTGLSSELAPKRLEILKELMPGLKRVAALWCPRAPINRVELGHVKAAAKTVGVHVESVEYNETPESWRKTLEAALRPHRPDALFLLDCSSLPYRAILEFALRHRLPTISPFKNVTRQGGLVSYGPDWTDITRRRVPAFVDKILKGAKPADLPVEQPTKFELVINLKTAKALELTIPQSFLLRVDDVIE